MTNLMTYNKRATHQVLQSFGITEPGLKLLFLSLHGHSLLGTQSPPSMSKPSGQKQPSTHVALSGFEGIVGKEQLGWASGPHDWYSLPSGHFIAIEGAKEVNINSTSLDSY